MQKWLIFSLSWFTEGNSLHPGCRHRLFPYFTRFPCFLHLPASDIDGNNNKKKQKVSQGKVKNSPSRIRRSAMKIKVKSDENPDLLVPSFRFLVVFWQIFSLTNHRSEKRRTLKISVVFSLSFINFISVGVFSTEKMRFFSDPSCRKLDFYFLSHGRPLNRLQKRAFKHQFRQSWRGLEKTAFSIFKSNFPINWIIVQSR